MHVTWTLPRRANQATSETDIPSTAERGMRVLSTAMVLHGVMMPVTMMLHSRVIPSLRWQ